MAAIPFVPWRPDISHLNDNYSSDVENVLMGAGRFIPFPSLAAFTLAVGAQPLGGLAARVNGVVHIFVGTATKLYKYNAGTTGWDDVSKPATSYGALVSERWRFRQFGNYVVAVNINNAPQVYQIGVSATFDNLAGSPPNARNLAIWGDRMALFSGPTVKWCDTNDISNWTTGTSGSRTFPDGGDIMAATDWTNPVIVQQRAIRVGTFVPGSTVTYSIQKVQDGKGAISPYAFGSRGSLGFFADSGAFWQVDGTGALTPIGFEKVDRTIFGLMGGAKPDAVYCEVDPFFQRAYFAVKINSATSSYDKILIYDWQIGEWTKADLRVGILFPLASGTTGLSLDDDAPGDVLLEDQGDVSLDSSIYEGGAPLMSAFTDDFKMGFFSGPNLQAVVTTQEVGGTTGGMTRVSDPMPIVDTAQCSVAIGSRNRRGDPVVYSADGVPSTRTGVVRMKSRARFQRFRLTIQAGAMWTAAQGIGVNSVSAGQQ